MKLLAIFILVFCALNAFAVMTINYSYPVQGERPVLFSKKTDEFFLPMFSFIGQFIILIQLPFWALFNLILSRFAMSYYISIPLLSVMSGATYWWFYVWLFRTEK